MNIFVPNAMSMMRRDDPQRLKEICNGCGTAGWKGRLVPDSVCGVSITNECNVHDFMYEFGVDDTDKKKADRCFLNNMVRKVKSVGGFLLWPRLLLVRGYYNTVKYFGGDAFWDGKNDPREVVEDDHFFEYLGED